VGVIREEQNAEKRCIKSTFFTWIMNFSLVALRNIYLVRY